jgi:hypothetical protein
MAKQTTCGSNLQVDQYNNLIECDHGYRVHLNPESCSRGHNFAMARGSTYIQCSQCGASHNTASVKGIIPQFSGIN